MKLVRSFPLLLSLSLPSRPWLRNSISSTLFSSVTYPRAVARLVLRHSAGLLLPDTGKPAADFGIHGLWPNYAVCRSGGAAAADAEFSIVYVARKKKCWSEYCDDGNPLSLLEIRDLLRPLDRSWPSLSCRNGGRSMQFWSYEWRKHGTCTAMDQHEYFEAALALKARHNLTAILLDSGIVPSDSRTYFLSSVRDAISEATGFAVNLECNRDEHGEAQLFQVYQCVDRNGKELIDCTLPMKSKCTDRVKLPTF